MMRWAGKAAQERMLEDARKALVASGEFLTLIDLAKLLGVDSRRLDHQLDRWKDHDEIFSIRIESEGELFPVFAFDRSCDLGILEPFPKILQMLGTGLSPLGIASWFIADCSYLDGQPPKDLLEIDPEWVIAAARDEMEEVSHG